MSSLRARWSVVCLAVAISLFLPALLSGQGTAGRIIGRVADPSGAILAGVKVTLVNEATNVSRDAKTNESGDYDFVEVPVGTYRLEFDLKGFKKNIRRGVSLDINQVITLNLTMQVGAAQETVDVTSEAPLVETTSTQLGAVVGDRAVSQLPLNSRDTYQLLQLQPGVMSTVGSSNSIVYGSSNAGAVSVNGGRGRSNNFNVNGGDANDQFANLPTVQPSPGRTWYFIRETPGVIGFAGTKDKPIPMRQSEVDSMLAQMKEREEKVKPKVSFEVGETVKVADGPFQNQNGIVEEIDPERGKLRVSVTIFGRATPVELEYWQVERG